MSFRCYQAIARAFNRAPALVQDWIDPLPIGAHSLVSGELVLISQVRSVFICVGQGRVPCPRRSCRSCDDISLTPFSHVVLVTGISCMNRSGRAATTMVSLTGCSHLADCSVIVTDGFIGIPSAPQHDLPPGRCPLPGVVAESPPRAARPRWPERFGVSISS